MANKKVTTGYTVDSRVADGRPIYAVMREYTYRGKPGEQLVTIYAERDVANTVATMLGLYKGKEY